MRIIKIILAALLIMVAAGFGTYFYFTRGLPSLETLHDYHPNLVTKVYSNDGRIIGEFFIERRIVVPFERVPKHLVQAFVAAEDSKFFEHEGISYTSILRAMLKNVTAGRVEADTYRVVCEGLHRRFEGLTTIAITLRGSISASHNTWSGVLWHEGRFTTGARYDITPIVDRVGGGDAFAGGLIYGLRAYDDPQRALDFAIAASCLKHSIFGDFNLVSVAEVEKLMGGDASGRVSR
jgi:hypothetical protein